MRTTVSLIVGITAGVLLAWSIFGAGQERPTPSFTVSRVQCTDCIVVVTPDSTTIYDGEEKVFFARVRP